MSFLNIRNGLSMIARNRVVGSTSSLILHNPITNIRIAQLSTSSIHNFNASIIRLNEQSVEEVSSTPSQASTQASAQASSQASEQASKQASASASSKNIKLTKKPLTDRKNERVVLWKMYGMFHSHNTLASLVAVVEDLDFVEKNQHLTYNDKVLYYLHLPHHTKLHISAGQLGFRKSQRSEYEAGFQVATKLFKTIEEQNLIGPNDKIELILKDFGKGRDAFQAALLGKEGQNIRPNIVRISDNTKLQFGGSRPKKLRRL